jgi:hypothetical protein
MWEAGMTDAPNQTAVPTSPSIAQDRLEVVYDEANANSRWMAFAGTMLGLAGLMRIIDSVWAFRYHGGLPDALRDGILGSSLHNYAWTWLIVGVILILSSFLVLVHSQFARWIGIIAAAIGGLSAMVWMPYYPAWSITYVAIAALVFYALVAHGGPEPGRS